MTAPAKISFFVCLFNSTLDQPIKIEYSRTRIPMTEFTGKIKNDRKIVNDTCPEHLIKKLTKYEITRSTNPNNTPMHKFLDCLV